MWGMHEGINFERRRANFLRIISKENFIRNSCTLAKAYPVDLLHCFELKKIHFYMESTVTFWLVWLVVTRVRQLGSDSLKARHPVITTFAHA